jgi:FKBP-type peptidyl-prolyl cis-trans isomerase (trigger factor)
MSMKSEGKAGEFLDQLQNDVNMQAKIKQGIEKLAKDNGYDLTEEELEKELRKRWQCRLGGGHYSEPPGF